jgi:hypothetical protein
MEAQMAAAQAMREREKFKSNKVLAAAMAISDRIKGPAKGGH